MDFDVFSTCFVSVYILECESSSSSFSVCFLSGRFLLWQWSLIIMFVTSQPSFGTNYIFLTGSNVNGGSMEARSMGVQRYHETASNRSSPSFQHPPPINHRHHSHHHPSPPMQAVRSPNINFHPQVAAPSYRVSTNSSRSTPTPALNSFEMGHRHPGSAAPTGLRIYRPHRGVAPEATLRHRNLPQLRVLQADVIFSPIVPFFCHSFIQISDCSVIWNLWYILVNNDYLYYLFLEIGINCSG